MADSRGSLRAVACLGFLAWLLAAGPDMKRFGELKVGDIVTVRYYESVVYAIQKPGGKAPAPATEGVVRGTGPKPGGTISEQMTAVVTIQAIDAKVRRSPSRPKTAA